MDNKKIEEMRFLESNLQSIALQKQAITMDMDEFLLAKDEVEKSNDSAYKIVGQILISWPKEKILNELDEKINLSKIRLSTIEKQEKMLLEKYNNLKKEILN